MPLLGKHRPFQLVVLCLLFFIYTLFCFSRIYQTWQQRQVLLEISENSIFLLFYLVIFGLLLGSVSFWVGASLWRGQKKARRWALVFYLAAFFIFLIEKFISWVFFGNVQRNILFLLLLWLLLFFWGWSILKSSKVDDFFN
jgi:hypothetical protein